MSKSIRVAMHPDWHRAEPGPRLSIERAGREGRSHRGRADQNSPGCLRGSYEDPCACQPSHSPLAHPSRRLHFEQIPAGPRRSISLGQIAWHRNTRTHASWANRFRGSSLASSGQSLIKHGSMESSSGAPWEATKTISPFRMAQWCAPEPWSGSFRL